MILGDASELAADAVSKSLIVSKVLLEEVLELRSYHLVLSLKATFILVLLLNHQSAEEQKSKKDLVRLVGPSSFEIILTLLAKLVAIQM